MLDIRERQDEQQRYSDVQSGTTEYYNYEQTREAYPQSRIYPQDRRATNDAQYSEYRMDSSLDMDSSYNYEYNNEAVFQPLSYNPEAESRGRRLVKKSQKTASASKLHKISLKGKVLIGVYFALITLIVVMISINAIPPISAQNSQSQEIVINQEGFNQTVSDSIANSNVVTNAPYTYDTDTNWFDRLCDSISGLFKG